MRVSALSILAGKASRSTAISTGSKAATKTSDAASSNDGTSKNPSCPSSPPAVRTEEVGGIGNRQSTTALTGSSGTWDNSSSSGSRRRSRRTQDADELNSEAQRLLTAKAPPHGRPPPPPPLQPPHGTVTTAPGGAAAGSDVKATPHTAASGASAGVLSQLWGRMREGLQGLLGPLQQLPSGATGAPEPSLSSSVSEPSSSQPEPPATGDDKSGGDFAGGEELMSRFGRAGPSDSVHSSTAAAAAPSVHQDASTSPSAAAAAGNGAVSHQHPLQSPSEALHFLADAARTRAAAYASSSEEGITGAAAAPLPPHFGHIPQPPPTGNSGGASGPSRRRRAIVALDDGAAAPFAADLERAMAASAASERRSASASALHSNNSNSCNNNSSNIHRESQLAQVEALLGPAAVHRTAHVTPPPPPPPPPSATARINEASETFFGDHSEHSRSETAAAAAVADDSFYELRSLPRGEGSSSASWRSSVQPRGADSPSLLGGSVSTMLKAPLLAMLRWRQRKQEGEREGLVGGTSAASGPASAEGETTVEGLMQQHEADLLRLAAAAEAQAQASASATAAALRRSEEEGHPSPLLPVLPEEPAAAAVPPKGFSRTILQAMEGFRRALMDRPPPPLPKPVVPKRGVGAKLPHSGQEAGFDLSLQGGAAAARRKAAVRKSGELQMDDLMEMLGSPSPSSSQASGTAEAAAAAAKSKKLRGGAVLSPEMYSTPAWARGPDGGRPQPSASPSSPPVLGKWMRELQQRLEARATEEGAGGQEAEERAAAEEGGRSSARPSLFSADRQRAPAGPPEQVSGA